MSGLNLNISLKGIDTSYPTLSTGEHLVNVVEFEVKDTKTAGLQQLRVTVETSEPTQDAKGNTVQPGFKSSTNLTLPNGSEHDDLRLKQLAAFIDACLKTDATTRPDFNEETLNSCRNKSVRVIVKAAKDTQYGETEIKGFKAV